MSNYKKIVIYFFLTRCAILSADLGPIRFAGDSNAIIATSTITTPGNYHLSRDITGPLTIAADNVCIDLRNNIIADNDFGIIIEEQKNIHIKNGTIQNNSQGIFISSCTNITIDGINFFTNSDSAIVMENTNNATIKNVQIERNSTSSRLINIDQSTDITLQSIYTNNNISLAASQLLRISQSNGIDYTNGSFNNNQDTVSNTDNLITISASANISINNCQCANNENYIQAILSEESSNIFFNNIRITQNTNLETGIYITDAQNIQLEACQINNNATSGALYGVFIMNSANVLSSNCQVIGNSAGDILQGFSAGYIGGPTAEILVTDIIFTHCVALDNVTTGVVANALRGFYLANTNFSGIINCTANRNQATSSSAAGIECSRTFLSFIENNTIFNNSGTSSFGLIFATAAPFNTTIFSNQAYGHGTDYATGVLPIIDVVYDISANTFTPSDPTNLHNVSTVL